MSAELVIVGADAPNIETMGRADLPVIWEAFDTKAARLIATAKTIVVTDVSQKAEMKLADETRKQLKKLRCEIEDKRKELVEGYKRAAGKIDETARGYRVQIQEVEDYLAEQAKFAERQEEIRRAKLKAERSAAMEPFGIDLSAYNLAEMTPEAFDQLYENTALAAEAKMAAAEKAAEEAKAKAKADAEERERMRLENERLRKEAEEREEALRIEREKAEHDRKEIAAQAERYRLVAEEKAKAERQAAEAEAARVRQQHEAEQRAAALKAQQEREAIEAKAKADREAAEAAAKKEREAREKIEAELRANAEAEAAKKRQAEEAAKKAAAAPDKTKLATLAAAIRSLPIPELTTEAGKALMSELVQQTEKFAAYVEKKAASL